MGANITAAWCANPPAFQRHGLGEPFHLSLRAVRDHRVEPGDDDKWPRIGGFALAGAYLGAYEAGPGNAVPRCDRHDQRPGRVLPSRPQTGFPVPTGSPSQRRYKYFSGRFTPSRSDSARNQGSTIWSHSICDRYAIIPTGLRRKYRSRNR